MRNYVHVIKNLPGIIARIERELQGKASTASVGHGVGQCQIRMNGLHDRLSTVETRLTSRPTLADLSQAKIDLGVRLDRLEAVIEKTGLADLATTLDQIAADQPEPGLRESIRETIAKAQDGLAARCASTDITPPAKKVRAPRKPKGSQ